MSITVLFLALTAASGMYFPFSAATAQETVPVRETVHESDRELIDRFDRYLQNLTTLTGNFTQTAPSGKISTGKFYLERPGLMRLEYNPPVPLLMVAAGGMVYLRDRELETTDSYPVGSTPLKFLLSGTVDITEAGNMTLVRHGESMDITFTPGEEEEITGRLTVSVSLPEPVITGWHVLDPQHGITVVTLDNVTAGGKIPARLFRVPEPGGMFLKNR